jgi:tetratricopeptide (TPR) repeat protein
MKIETAIFTMEWAAIALLSLAALCLCAAAEGETAADWYIKGQDLYRYGSCEEAVRAYDKAIELNQSFAQAWAARAEALSLVGMQSSGKAQNETLDDALQSANMARDRPQGREILGEQRIRPHG